VTSGRALLPELAQSIANLGIDEREGDAAVDAARWGDSNLKTI
jgi:hypothetical protein